MRVTAPPHIQRCYERTAHNNRVLSFTIDFRRDGTVGNLHVI